MKKIAVVLVLGTALLATAPGFGQRGMMRGRGAMMGVSVVRHRFVMQQGVDPAYAAKRNPLKADAETIARGKKLYEQYCALCHGAAGHGDGEAGKNLVPPPSNVASAVHMPVATDGFLYWTIAEGGVPVKSAMPPFKDGLKADEIWTIITYLRSL
jgi:mono/diheme cytochrome c family protein